MRIKFLLGGVLLALMAANCATFMGAEERERTLHGNDSTLAGC